MTILEAVQSLAPSIAARAQEIEDARRLPIDLVETFARAGLFRMLVPKRLGGLELSPIDIVETIEAVARADASAGWCVMIAATSGMEAAYLSEPYASEIFADPMGVLGGVFAPMGRAVRDGDDYIVNGRWKWASGSQHCTWLAGGCVVIEDGAPILRANGQPDHRMMLFRASEAELIDTWHVMGLKGTGSVDMAARDVRVPVGRSVSLISDAPIEPGPLYRFPAFGMLAMGIAAVACGNALAALEELRAVASAKRPAGGGRALAERGVVQAEFARATASLLGARAFFIEAIERAWKTALGGAAIPIEARAEVRLAATSLVRTAAEAVRSVHDMAGGASVFLESSLQRRFRDAHVATQHMMVGPATLELTGRVLLGLETDASTL